jgi:hypothetical protein
MRSLSVGVLFLLGAACGPVHKDSQNPQAQNDKDPQMVCHEESDTGSLMSHRVCQPINHTTSADDKHDTEQMLGKPRSSPTMAH